MKPDTLIAVGLLVLTVVLVWLTWLLVEDDRRRTKSPFVETRIIDAAIPSDRVRVIVRAPAGATAKDFQVRPVGMAVQATDPYGECSFDNSCRGSTADLFDATGNFVTSLILPVSGHLEVRILRLASQLG